MLLLCSMVLPFTASASTWYINGIDPINMSKTAPTLDGVISADEGWSKEDAVLSEDTVGYFGLPNQYLSGSGNMYFAYTDEGLYFAMDYTDLGAAYCVKFYDEEGNGAYVAVYADANAANYTASDGGFPATTPDGKAVDYYLVDNYTMNVPDVTFPCGAYWRSSLDQYFTNNTLEYSDDIDYLDQGSAAWSGDVFVLSLDPLGLLESEGFIDEKGVNYAIGVASDGSVKVGLVNSTADTDVSDSCKGKGIIDNNKMHLSLEVMIPWEIIAEGANLKAAEVGLDHSFTAEELAADSVEHRATIIYYDRFFSDDIDDIDTWGRFITVCVETSDGHPGYGTSGDVVKCMALKLKTAEASAPVDSESSEDSQSESGDTTSSGNGGATTTKNGSTTTKSQNSGKKSSGGSSAQTFDAGIAAAIGALAVSAIGIGYSRKRK